MQIGSASHAAFVDRDCNRGIQGDHAIHVDFE